MQKILVFSLIVLSLSGCASKLPTCNGLDQRPVNAPAQVGINHLSCGAAA